MAFIQISNSNLDNLRDLVKQSKAIGQHKELKDFSNEAFAFYFAYLGFLVNEKNSIIVMKDLENSEDPEKALSDLEKLLEAMINHLAKDSFQQYKISKDILLKRIEDEKQPLVLQVFSDILS
jgi:hypothetical protein